MPPAPQFTRVYHSNRAETLFYGYGGNTYSRRAALAAFEAGEYTLVTTIQRLPPITLQQVFERTQGEHPSWAGTSMRSTSVGDIIERDGMVFIVAPQGFDLLRETI